MQTKGFVLFLAISLPLAAQRGTGELRLLISDPSGLGLEAFGTLVSQSTQVRQVFQTDTAGRGTLKVLPFGAYRLQVEHAGFLPVSGLVEIRSEVPVVYRVTLGVAPIETAITVTDSDTLLDAHRTGNLNYIGPDLLRDRRSTLPGRSVLDVVNTQPGWLLEANGVLHPRGSEYQVQYVIDGIPLFDNRSPAFAQSLGVEEFESMNVRTGGYPAEYGRKLGGVIEAVTNRDSRPGFHGNAVLEGGSFASRNAYLSGQYGWERTTAGLSLEGIETDRYLDPPVVQNYTNHGSGGGFAARLERDWSGDDRTRFYAHRRRTGFLVPNETLQQEAGQRQDRTAEETLGQISHQHVFSPQVLGAVRAMVRDTSAALWSNPFSTPLLSFQDRGFRETYLGGSISAHYGMHDELKAGADAIFSSIHEYFAIPRNFTFADRRQDREQGLFVQDQARLGPFTISAGLRYDHYRLLVDETAVSPRVAASWYLASASLLMRASYDRAFQTPAVENLLLAGSGISGFSLPLRPSRGHFYEAGLSKSVFGKLRLDGSYFRRNVDNFADDSLLLNTGVSFPIAFARATVTGYEAKLELPRWGPVSAFASYGNLIGRGQFPIAGGLFLDEGAQALLHSTETFPITQDQRNTARARLRFQLHPRVWMACSGQYDSGLPAEIDEGFDRNLLVEQYGQAVVNRVNFDRGRVRPSASADAAAGVELRHREKQRVQLQMDLRNLTNRLNVLDFAGLFSGTAIAPARTFAIRLQASF